MQTVQVFPALFFSADMASISYSALRKGTQYAGSTTRVKKPVILKYVPSYLPSKTGAEPGARPQKLAPKIPYSTRQLGTTLL